MISNTSDIGVIIREFLIHSFIGVFALVVAFRKQSLSVINVPCITGNEAIAQLIDNKVVINKIYR